MLLRPSKLLSPVHDREDVHAACLNQVDQTLRSFEHLPDLVVVCLGDLPPPLRKLLEVRRPSQQPIHDALGVDRRGPPDEPGNGRHWSAAAADQ